jgi:hypothetical protein
MLRRRSREVATVAAVKKEEDQVSAETPRARFLRLAPPRVQGALNRMRQIGNLSGPGYESTEADREKIITAMFDAVHEMKRRLENKHEKSAFKL